MLKTQTNIESFSVYVETARMYFAKVQWVEFEIYVW